MTKAPRLGSRSYIRHDRSKTHWIAHAQTRGAESTPKIFVPRSSDPQSSSDLKKGSMGEMLDKGLGRSQSSAANTQEEKTWRNSLKEVLHTTGEKIKQATKWTLKDSPLSIIVPGVVIPVHLTIGTINAHYGGSTEFIDTVFTYDFYELFLILIDTLDPLDFEDNPFTSLYDYDFPHDISECGINPQEIKPITHTLEGDKIISMGLVDDQGNR